MTSTRIAIGTDHRGTEAAQALAQALEQDGHTVELIGPQDPTQSVDYPEQAWEVGQRISSHNADFGILLCGTAIGMSIAANKIPGVRAAVVHDELTGELSRSHNDANVLCLSGDLLGRRLIEKITKLWLSTPFEGGRHARRVEQINRIESGHAPSEEATA